MANMSYCRFQNTLSDMLDCQMALEDGKELSKEESSARESLLQLCRELADEYLDEDGNVKGIQMPFHKWVEEVDAICCEGSNFHPIVIEYVSSSSHQAEAYANKLTPDGFMQLAETTCASLIKIYGEVKSL